MLPTNNFHYNMIKGRVAEAIIKELFLVNGYRVYDYGMERTLPHAVENVKYQKDEMSLSIHHMPDFLVQHIKTGVLNYVEVKYRANGEFSFAEIENNPYKSTCFVVVSKVNIQSIITSKTNWPKAINYIMPSYKTNPTKPVHKKAKFVL